MKINSVENLKLQNFYKDEINREEMYIRYVNKLFELHMVANNYTEAGLTLQLYAKLLNWSEKELLAELRYQKQKEAIRKETLYLEIINCFDKGKVCQINPYLYNMKMVNTLWGIGTHILVEL